MAPAAGIIFLFGLFPIGYAMYTSLYDWRVVRTGFVGLENYRDLLGSASGALAFGGGLALLMLAYALWNGAFDSRSSWRTAGRLGAAFVLMAAGVSVALGWGRMAESGDRDFLSSLPITLYYALGTVPAQIGIGLVLAYLLYQKVRGQTAFRMLFFLPYVTPIVAAAVVFRTIFNPDESSLANQVLGLFGIGPQRWLFDSRPVVEALFGLEVSGALAGPSVALVSIMMYGVWTFVGFNVVILLAGLAAIPRQLYEAAEIDGANGWRLFRHITIPMLSPVTYYLALIGFIGTMRAFDHVYVMRVPSAQGTVDVASIVIFDTFYRANQYGYASAQAILLFVIILGLTLAQNRILGDRVFYD